MGEYLPLMASSVSSQAIALATGQKSTTTIVPSIVCNSDYGGYDPIRYPIKAIFYTLNHPKRLLPVVIRIACIGCMISTVILIVLLATTLKPQAELISSELHWWAWLIAVFIVLLEAAICSVLVMVISQSKAQTMLFTETMRMYVSCEHLLDIFCMSFAYAIHILLMCCLSHLLIIFMHLI